MTQVKNILLRKKNVSLIVIYNFLKSKTGSLSRQQNVEHILEDNLIEIKITFYLRNNVFFLLSEIMFLPNCLIWYFSLNFSCKITYIEYTEGENKSNCIFCSLLLFLINWTKYSLSTIDGSFNDISLTFVDIWTSCMSCSFGMTDLKWKISKFLFIRTASNHREHGDRNNRVTHRLDRINEIKNGKYGTINSKLWNETSHQN